LQSSDLADVVSPDERPAAVPAPAELPAVTLPAAEAAEDDRTQTLPDIPTVTSPAGRATFKTCALAGGRSLRVRRGTPCPRVGVQVDETTRSKLQQRRQTQQQPSSPAPPPAGTGQQPPAAQQPAPAADGSGGAKYPGR
jgi:hypothetical protein